MQIYCNRKHFAAKKKELLRNETNIKNSIADDSHYKKKGMLIENDSKIHIHITICIGNPYNYHFQLNKYQLTY